jgi:hypothetical protein
MATEARSEQTAFTAWHEVKYEMLIWGHCVEAFRVSDHLSFSPWNSCHHSFVEIFSFLLSYLWSLIRVYFGVLGAKVTTYFNTSRACYFWPDGEAIQILPVCVNEETKGHFIERNTFRVIWF